MYVCVSVSEKSLWDSSRFVNIRTCFLASYFLLNVFCAAQVSMCMCVPGDNCFLARKTSLSSDQVSTCSLLSLRLNLLRRDDLSLYCYRRGWSNEWTIERYRISMPATGSLARFVIVIHLLLFLSSQSASSVLLHSIWCVDDSKTVDDPEQASSVRRW